MRQSMYLFRSNFQVVGRLALAALILACGCKPETADPPLIRYGSAAPVGTWHPDSADSPTDPAESGANTSNTGSSQPLANPQDLAGAAAPVLPMTGGSGAAPTAGSTGSSTQSGRNGGSGGASGGSGGSVALPMAGSTAMTAGSGGSDVPVETGTGLASLSFSVLTKTLNGRYSPKNIGAIWIETADGKFVKTLEVWAGIRVRYLSRWRSEAMSNKVDAITSATLRSHVTHSPSWDLTNASGGAVAAGDYKVVVEMTDHDGTGDSTEVPFTLEAPMMMTPPDATHFVDMTVSVE